MSISEKPTREEEARRYLEEHGILNILNDLTSSLLYYRPENPRAFLINELTKLHAAKISYIYVPQLLDEANAAAIFDTLDPTKQNFITEAQYTQTMKQLGIAKFDKFQPPESDKITCEMFTKQFKSNNS